MAPRSAVSADPSLISAECGSGTRHAIYPKQNTFNPIFTESQFKTLRAEYTLNRAGGIEELRYACTVAPENKQCFSH